MQRFGASDGLSLAYYIDDFTDPWRDAPTLLMLHAAMGSARRYFAWVPHLARDWRVVRLDLRGHGSSQVPPAEEPLALDRLVADVAELMDHLGVGSAHIVGNSAGGYLGQQMAMTRPERVESSGALWLDPGAQTEPSTKLDTADRGEGAARLSRRDDPRSVAGRCRSRPGELVSRRGGEEQPGLHRQIRAADGEL